MTAPPVVPALSALPPRSQTIRRPAPSNEVHDGPTLGSHDAVTGGDRSERFG